MSDHYDQLEEQYDRIVEACANIVYGKEWWMSLHGIIGSRDHRIFHPLTNAATERAVFEHAHPDIREKARKRLADKYGSWDRYLDYSKVGDISRAIAEVVLEVDQ